MNPFERHAAMRLNQRYGVRFDRAFRRELFAHIEAARANDNQSPRAALIQARLPRERWLVSVHGRILHVVIDQEAEVIVTFLPLHGKRS